MPRNDCKIPTEERGVEEIAHRSRGTPRVALRLLRRVRDYAQVRAPRVLSPARLLTKQWAYWALMPRLDEIRPYGAWYDL